MSDTKNRFGVDPREWRGGKNEQSSTTEHPRPQHPGEQEGDKGDES